MSLLDKLKSMFTGGSSDTQAGHDHAGHDHAGHDHPHEPATPPLPPADPALTGDPAHSADGEDKPS